MSYLRPFAAKCAAAAIAVQLASVPATADGISLSSGGFIFIDSKSVSLHYRSKHHVNRYYIAPRIYHYKAKPKVYYHKANPKAYHHKTKPKVYYVKPVKRHYRSSSGQFNRLSSPYYMPKRYGIQHRNYHRGFSPYRY